MGTDFDSFNASSLGDRSQSSVDPRGAFAGSPRTGTLFAALGSNTFIRVFVDSPTLGRFWDQFYSTGASPRPASFGHMAALGASLYVSDGSNCLAWDGSNWSTIASTSGANGVGSLGAHVWVRSSSTTIGGVSAPARVARWDLTTWSAVGSGSVANTGAAPIASGAGVVTRSGDSSNAIASSGGNWSDAVTSVVVGSLWARDGEVVMGGRSTTFDAGYWDFAGVYTGTGSSLTPTGPDFEIDSSAAVTEIVAAVRHAGDLWCATNTVDLTTSEATVYQLVGSTWTARGTFTLSGLHTNVITAMESGLDGYLYVGGRYSSGPDSSQYSARWDSDTSSWESVYSPAPVFHIHQTLVPIET